MASLNGLTRQALQALRRPGSVLSSVELQAIGGELVPRDFATQPLQPTVATRPGREAAKLGRHVRVGQPAADDVRESAGFCTAAVKNFL